MAETKLKNQAYSRPFGVLSLKLDGPANSSQSSTNKLTFTTKNIEQGILSADASTDQFSSSKDCLVKIDLNLVISTTSTADTQRLYISTNNGSSFTNISTWNGPPSAAYLDMRFSFLLSMVAGTNYSLWIQPNGGSGTHTIYTSSLETCLIIHTI